MISRARATRGLRRPSLDARSGRSSRPPSREEKASELGGTIQIAVLVRRPQSGLTRVPFLRRANEQAWWELFHGRLGERARPRKGREGKGSRQTILFARRAPTMKQWSLDARSKGQSGGSPGKTGRSQVMIRISEDARR